MFDAVYEKVEDGMTFEKIEDAMMTACHICGTPLEWEIYPIWNNLHNRVNIGGIAFSCGATFLLAYLAETSEYIITIKEREGFQ